MKHAPRTKREPPGTPTIAGAADGSAVQVALRKILLAVSVVAAGLGETATHHVTVTTADGSPGGGSIWGWGGIAITSDDHVWAAIGNANTGASEDETEPYGDSVAELSPALALIGSGAAVGIPLHGDYGFGSTPIVFKPTKCAPLVTAEGKDGALYVWRRAALAAGPVQRLVLAFPATLYGSPAWDPTTQRLFLTTTQGYDGAPSGLRRASGYRQLHAPSCLDALARRATQRHPDRS